MKGKRIKITQKDFKKLQQFQNLCLCYYVYQNDFQVSCLSMEHKNKQNKTKRFPFYHVCMLKE